MLWTSEENGENTVIHEYKHGNKSWGQSQKIWGETLRDVLYGQKDASTVTVQSGQ